MSSLSHILSSNAKWAKDVEQTNPGFFAASVERQSPKIVWIGCADSRVPESVITASRPGDIFVHRNIANQVHVDDDSVLSILTFAIEVLGIEHVVVVGHTECGGAAACYAASQAQQETATALPPTAPINRWLAPLLALTRSLPLSDMPAAEATSLIVEENVKAQVANLCKTEPVTRAWSGESGKQVWVHGWVYELGTGTLKDLGVSKGPSTPT